jgi:hypothetical protein
MKLSKIIITILGLFFFGSCANNTRITRSWRNPDKQITISSLNKVLVVAMFKTLSENRIAEDQIASYLQGKGVASYNYLNENFNKDNEEIIRNKIKSDGFDGAITMRLIDIEKENSYTPGNINSYPVNYRTFGGYYYQSWRNYSTPGYYTTTKTYTIEVNVFSIKDDKIIWTGVTRTTNPDGVEKMTAEVTDVVFNKMIKEGFLIR